MVTLFEEWRDLLDEFNKFLGIDIEWSLWDGDSLLSKKEWVYVGKVKGGDPDRVRYKARFGMIHKVVKDLKTNRSWSRNRNGWKLMDR